MYLELVVIQDAMTAADLSFVHNQINMTSAAYIKMRKIYRKIEALQESTSSKDDLDDLKGDLDDVKATLRSCQEAGNRESVAMTITCSTNATTNCYRVQILEIHGAQKG